MVQLFLSNPNWDDDDESTSVDVVVISLFNKLESVIWSLITSGGRSEPRLWLCKSISGLTCLTPSGKHELFWRLLKSKPFNKALASQLLLMVFEKCPSKVGPILAKKSYVLKKFFQGNPRRIMQWFSNFGESGLEHRNGAKALSQFAFVNRDICWEELEWKGKHGQSPAVVATKPHYFLDLDVQRSVENFLENVPEFWSSDEFAKSLDNGDILSIDAKFFTGLFVGWMYKDDSAAVWELIDDFLVDESFSSLCHSLLIILEESDFCFFLELLQKHIKIRPEINDFGNSNSWLEILLSKSVCMDELLLLNAVVNQRRQILHIVRDDEHQEEQAEVKDIVSHICTTLNSASGLTPVLKRCLKLKTAEVTKLLGLQSWVLHYLLSIDCQTPASWEALFASNGIMFRKSDKYSLINDALSEENEPESDSRRKHKKKDKSRKKKRRKFDLEESFDHRLLDFDGSDHGSGEQGGSWLLSTDEFSASWTNVSAQVFTSEYERFD
ncbi:hypothetical protein ACFE04_000751 [Oxalis oulophora]